ncbi:NAD-dependent epimerase/dehydratase family protein [Georgenia sp. TF02-10]|uniref:NAD-dependent epimerase/dehydratase family protein n=1 Tax=Georgenia sp. TF02-10 TaxID=2917725 RepID=UPI001FA7E420|nr:NAD-dependent epimerase/dehydratase family protein [Georgenia sp. TF02-10]UNX54805.1 NAD-dependent epimerase/dehydratase family protein [Georgenia sp. TF02-10]
MRVAVIGASGNVGSAVLRALAAEPAVTSVLGVARRLPDRSAPPFDAADWLSLDLAAEDEADVVDRLATALAGADAVVHLAWAIQPNTERDYMRRLNVGGTRRVADAAVRAGVRHLVVASSWGVYSPVQDDVPRTEDAPREGIRSSHYSVDKAAQERVLDELEAEHPEITVTRMRTALIFQADAGAEIARYFLGPFVPLGLLRPGVLPVLPLPGHLRLQVVHADDAGRAYATVVAQRAGGAFNVAAADTLWPVDLARILDHGHIVPVPPALVRPLVHYAWRARLVAADAGWLDMGLGVPVMDTTRIRALGWRETRSAEDALRELLDGLRDRRGLASPVLRAKDRNFGGPVESAPARAGLGNGRGRGGAGAGGGAGGGGRHRSPALAAAVGPAHVPPHLDAGLLGLYLSDHLTGATAGLGRMTRMAEAYADTPMADDLAAMASQLREERDLLRELIHALGLRQRPYRQAAAQAGELVGRLKLNRRVLTRSPMTPLLEIEVMRGAVLGKLGVWQTLADHAEELGLPAETFVSLADRARDQAATLDLLHERSRRTAFRGGSGTD